jgi:hypothetical protein
MTTMTTKPMLAALALFVLASCADERISSPVAPQFGPSGAGGAPTIKSVSPNVVIKGSTLDITVNGSGFDRGTRAEFGVNGVASPYVVTNRTTYLSGKQLIANVTISTDAQTDLYDAIVILSDGKKGIGTDMLGVDDPVLTMYISNSSDVMLRGDNQFIDFDGTSRYSKGECGVGSTFFLSPGASGDGTMGTADARDPKCANYPRRLRVTYQAVNVDGSTSNEGSVSVKSFLNVRKLQKKDSLGVYLNYIPVGETQMRTMAFSDENLKCGDAGIGAILFSARTQDGIIVGADSVRVTRTASDTWQVVTVPDEINASTGETIHHDKAWCRGNGKLYHMPVRLTIKTAAALP